MKLSSKLPLDRRAEGTLVVVGEGDTILLGPVRCRGEADLENATKQDNVDEDPTRIGGDHPAGTYRVAEIVPASVHRKPDTYGPFFIRINPVAGEAWDARQHGRGGFGIHGGKLLPDGQLRPTFGCLRVEDATDEQLAALIIQARKDDAGIDVFYQCAVAP